MPEQNKEKLRQPYSTADGFGPSRDEMIDAIITQIKTERAGLSNPPKVIEGQTVSELIDDYQKAGGNLTKLAKTVASFDVQFETNPSVFMQSLVERRIKQKRQGPIKKAA